MTKFNSTPEMLPD